ncbi:MAG: hypothetical protein GY715_13835 [Planctomycetes bacterium]|nr:hypothetical protein [Planctomycetota bacterium]
MSERLKKLVIVAVVVLIVAGMVIIGTSAMRGGGLDPERAKMIERRAEPAETRTPPGRDIGMTETPADE